MPTLENSVAFRSPESWCGCLLQFVSIFLLWNLVFYNDRMFFIRAGRAPLFYVEFDCQHFSIVEFEALDLDISFAHVVN